MTPPAARAAHAARHRPARAASASMAAAAVLLAGCSTGGDDAPAGTADAAPTAGTAPGEPTDGSSAEVGSEPPAATPEPTAAPEQTATGAAALSPAEVQEVLAQVQVGELAEGTYEPVGDELVVCGAPEVGSSVAGGDLVYQQLGAPGQEVVLIEAMVFPDAAAAAAAADPAVVAPQACDGLVELDGLSLTYSGGVPVDAGDAAVETSLSGISPQLPDGAVDVSWVALQGNVVWRVTGGSGSNDEARSRELLTEAAGALQAGLQQD